MAFRFTLKRLASKLSSAEREAALRDANEKMKLYYTNRPPIDQVIKKRKFGEGPRSEAHFLQLFAVSSFLTLFLCAPFLGRKIAKDEEFRKKYIPSWYDFTTEKPDYAWTRQELHEQQIMMQNELRERAIRGEFTEEKLQEMRRHFEGRDEDKIAREQGWDLLHPGVDDDEDLEDE
jgi:hypothetical protein